MEEDFRDLSLHPLFRPIRVLPPDSSRLHLASGPVQLFRQAQTFLTWERVQCSDLLGAWPFLIVHGDSVVENMSSIKADDDTNMGMHPTPCPSLLMVRSTS
jgi:hypothetical protein